MIHIDKESHFIGYCEAIEDFLTHKKEGLTNEEIYGSLLDKLKQLKDGK